MSGRIRRLVAAAVADLRWRIASDEGRTAERAISVLGRLHGYVMGCGCHAEGAGDCAFYAHKPGLCGCACHGNSEAT